jgi:hypothetical protein
MFGSKRVVTLLVGGLVAGVILGSVSTGFAATAANSAPGQAVANCGIGVGSAVRAAGGRLVDVVAKLTGQTPAQVREQRASGKTLTQIAADKNVSTSAVLSEALKVREQALSARVKSGAITQSQADTALAAMQTRITQRVNDPAACTGTGTGAGAGAGAGGGRGRGGRGAGGGMGDGTCRAN